MPCCCCCCYPRLDVQVPDVSTPPCSASDEFYTRVCVCVLRSHLQGRIQLPCMLVDLVSFDANCLALARKAEQYGKTIRIATKSLRVPHLIARALTLSDTFQGVPTWPLGCCWGLGGSQLSGCVNGAKSVFLCFSFLFFSFLFFSFLFFRCKGSLRWLSDIRYTKV